MERPGSLREALAKDESHARRVAAWKISRELALLLDALEKDEVVITKAQLRTARRALNEYRGIERPLDRHG